MVDRIQLNNDSIPFDPSFSTHPVLINENSYSAGINASDDGTSGIGSFNGRHTVAGVSEPNQTISNFMCNYRN